MKNFNKRHLLLAFISISICSFQALSTVFSGSTVTQYHGPCLVSATSQRLIKLTLNTGGGPGSAKINGLDFTITGFSQCVNAKLWYHATTDDFSTATLYDTDATFGASGEVSFTFAEVTVSGPDYFYVTVDIAGSITDGTVIDATYTGSTCSSNALDLATPTDATGFRIANTSYELGTGGTFNHYATIGEVATLINSSTFLIETGVTNIYFELLSNTTTESAISFTYTGSATITFRPQTGKTGLITTPNTTTTIGSTAAFITFSGADNIVFDGRPGGVGTTISDIEWTVRNTRTAATPGSVFKYISDASNNTLQFLNIEGEAYTFGLIQISTATTTGNDDNIFSYCTIQDLTSGGTANFPSYGLRSIGTVGKENSGSTIDNCHFIDVYYADLGTGGVIQLSTANTTWTVTNNHFYQNSATTLPSLSFGWAFIQCFTGGGYTITGNYIGGTAASSGGTAYTVSGTSFIYAIYVDAACTGATITLNSNVIANIDITSTSTSTYFMGFYLAGSANLTVGDASVGSSTGNRIGIMTGTGNILVTHNSGSGSTGFYGISIYSSGTNKIDYNQIGGITEAGSLTGTTSYGIYLSNGTNTLKYNKIGGDAIANSVNISVANSFRGIYNSSTNGVTIENSTIQHITQVGSTNSLYGIYNNVGILTCTDNTITNFTTSVNSYVYGILHFNSTPLTTAATVTGNNLNTFTLTGATSHIIGIDIETNGTIICNTNTIGSSTNNNMDIQGDNTSYGIYFDGSSASLTCNSNTIQEFLFSNTGVSTVFNGIYATGSGVLSASSNTITQIDNASTIGGTSIRGIYSASSGAGINLLSNIISNLNSTTTSAVNTIVRGISVTTGTGNIKKNKITALTNTATSSPRIYGIALTSSWDIHNNVVIIDNSSNTNAILIYGAYDGSTGTVTVYHNTFKIGGSSTAGSLRSASYYRYDAGTQTVKNNIFQNIRSGGTGGHYAEYYSVTTGTIVTDKNYLEVTEDVNKIGYYGAAYNFADFKTNSGATNSLNGTNTIDANGYAPTGFTGASQGVDLFTGSIVIDDKAGTTRATSPWMGAFEGAAALPIELFSFEGFKKGVVNLLIWKTSSEFQNDFFTIEKSEDGINFHEVGTVNGAINSSTMLNYALNDNHVKQVVNYYRLSQTDLDGEHKIVGFLSIDNSLDSKEIERITNLLGQDINTNYKGIVIILYTDGSSLKTVQ
jgi:hypothetical protein